jgi:two-component system phosphate regulon sensor histidine kinase PhoR
MKKSFFLKIIGSYILIILLLSTLILLFSFQTIKSHYIELLTVNLKNICLTLKSDVTQLKSAGDVYALENFIKKTGQGINTRLTVIEKSGQVLADSEDDPQKMENHRFRPEIIQALNGKVGRAIRLSPTTKKEMLYLALPLEKNGQITGVLRASLFLKNINILLAAINLRILGMALILVIFSFLLALIFSRHLSRPVSELVAAAKKIAAGDFDFRIFLKRNDELKELSDNFNQMTAQLKSLFTEVSLKKEELKSIISALMEGLIVVDSQDKVVLANDSFQKISGTGEPEGKKYWEILPEAQFTGFIKECLAKKASLTREIIISGRIYLLNAVLTGFQNELVVIFHDITDLKNLGKIKRDFILNVSHELRTPLTAIKGFVETLEGETGKSRSDYLEIIRKHTERLIRIVRDLQILSRLEEPEVQLEKETVDVGKLVENVIKIFEPRLKEKALELVWSAPKILPAVKADPFKLEQVFFNLIDNAINYTDRGKLTLSLYPKNGVLIFEIEDTGVGIPSEHLSRIFERFYVVDKSRSKKMGGTGLGLSIVKHIDQLHGGRIEVASTPGKGTKFVVILPLN